VWEKLRQISAATIDRLLKEERAKRRVKGIAHTKPITLLKSSIPILVSSELPREQPGYYQVDLVGHDGGNPNGHFAYSLNAVELSSGWIEPRCLLNRARVWTKKALISLKTASPVPVKGLHSDNDSSFLNERVQEWSAQEGIPYSRARPYHSNDTCFVEQKNYNIVRQAVGYARYETEQEVALIGELYERLRLLINFFYPSMKLLKKIRLNSRIHKKYDKPKTPARRLIEHPLVDKAVKKQLRAQLKKLDPFALKRDIERLQSQLLQLARRKNGQILYPGPPSPGARDRMWEQLFAGSPRKGRS